MGLHRIGMARSVGHAVVDALLGELCARVNTKYTLAFDTGSIAAMCWTREALVD